MIHPDKLFADARGRAWHPDAKFRALQASVRFILAHADKFEWSLQGMGMLRLYLGDTRLHVWDQTHAAPGVSMIHDHQQWGLRSTVIAGSLINQRYVERGQWQPMWFPFHAVTLKAGYGCAFVDQPRLTWLRPLTPECYGPGESYGQLPGEIHESKPQGIVVTLMQKLPTGSDLARVFWPQGSQWGSAEPRPATRDEIVDITRKAVMTIDDAMARGNSP